MPLGLATLESLVGIAVPRAKTQVSILKSEMLRQAYLPNGRAQKPECAAYQASPARTVGATRAAWVWYRLDGVCAI